MQLRLIKDDFHAQKHDTVELIETYADFRAEFNRLKTLRIYMEAELHEFFKAVNRVRTELRTFIGEAKTPDREAALLQSIDDAVGLGSNLQGTLAVGVDECKQRLREYIG